MLAYMKRWSARWPLSFALCVLITAILSAAAAEASASIPTNHCDGRSYSAVVKNYKRGAATLPLRCGTSTWGFIHFTARWNDSFDGKIALTISRGEEVNDVQGDGGSKIYALFDDRCKELFRVIYNGGAYRGNDVRPQGIITAYERPSSINTAYERQIDLVSYAGQDLATAPSYRTDCPVIQRI